MPQGYLVVHSIGTSPNLVCYDLSNVNVQPSEHTIQEKGPTDSNVRHMRTWLDIGMSKCHLVPLKMPFKHTQYTLHIIKVFSLFHVLCKLTLLSIPFSMQKPADRVRIIPNDFSFDKAHVVPNVSVIKRPRVGVKFLHHHYVGWSRVSNYLLPIPTF